MKYYEKQVCRQVCERTQGVTTKRVGEGGRGTTGEAQGQPFVAVRVRLPRESLLRLRCVASRLPPLHTRTHDKRPCFRAPGGGPGTPVSIPSFSASLTNTLCYRGCSTRENRRGREPWNRNRTTPGWISLTPFHRLTAPLPSHRPNSQVPTTRLNFSKMGLCRIWFSFDLAWVFHFFALGVAVWRGWVLVGFLACL